MTLQIVQTPNPRSPQAQYRFNKPTLEFLDSNLESLTLGVGTARAIRRAADKYKVSTLSDGAPIVEVGSFVLGRPLSHREVARSLEDIGEDSVVIVFGLGTGQAVRAVRSMCRVPVLVYEPDASVLQSVLSYGPLAMGDVPIVCGLSELAWHWRKFKSRELNVRVVVTPGYRQAYREQVQSFLEEVPSLLQRTAISRSTYNCRAQIWVRDILDNLPRVLNSPPFLRLENVYAGVPAFVVGAGPSLDKNIHHLREAVSKGIVFATNSGAMALARHGIEPQVVVCIESIDCSENLKKLPCLDKSVRAFSLSAAPASLAVGKGPLLPLHEAIPQYDGPLQQLTGVSGVLTFGSVSTTALSLARIAGCSPIVLVGQDLAYTDGATYAEGTGYEASAARVDEQSGRVHFDWSAERLRSHGTSRGSIPKWENFQKMPRWGGGQPVASTVSFSNIRDWFEGLAILLKNAVDPPRLINATEGGARIEGYEEIPLQQLLSSLPTRHDLAPEALAARANLDWRAPTAQYVDEWLSSIGHGVQEVERKARRCRRVASYARRAMRVGDSQVVVTAYSRLDVAERELRQAVLNCPMVDAWSHGAVTQASGKPLANTDDARKKALHAMGRSIRVAMAIERSAKALCKQLSLSRITGEEISATSTHNTPQT